MATDAFNQWLRPEMGAPGVEVISTTRAGGVSSGKFAGFNVGVHVGDSDEAVQATALQWVGGRLSASLLSSE